VLVNGVPVIDHGEMTGALPGKSSAAPVTRPKLPALSRVH